MTDDARRPSAKTGAKRATAIAATVGAALLVAFLLTSDRAPGPVSEGVSGPAPDSSAVPTPDESADTVEPAPTHRAGLPREVHEIHVDVGGTSVRALCTDGPRRAVLLHDADRTADSWIQVLRRLDGRAGACAYDRPTASVDGRTPVERGWYELLDELRRIHLALGFERGYVLVGHGLGGLYGRVYAQDRPRDVAGLVLVEPNHEDMPTRVRSGMPASDWNAWQARRSRPGADGIVEARIGDRARAGRLPAIPVTVITAAVRTGGDGWDVRFVNEAARQVHEQIVRSVESGRHVPASRSGPDVPRDDPQLVADEILRTVGAVGR